MKDSLSEKSEDFEPSEVGSKLVRTGCSNQAATVWNFQNVIDLLQLKEEQAEQLDLGMVGEVNREGQVGIKY